MNRFTQPKLRVMATAAFIALSVMVVAVCTALVLLTTRSHRTTVALRNAVANVEFAERAELELLMHERARDAVVRVELADRLRRSSAKARRHVTSPAEQRLVYEAGDHIDRYLRMADEADADPRARAEALAAAYGSLERLIAINVDQADSAVRESMRWDALGDALGISTGALMLAVLSTLLWWTHRAVARPLLSLSTDMERFTRGELDVRTREFGAEELRQMGSRFNLMADALSRQHEERQTYLAAVAHDLRNPLAALKMTIDVIATNQAMPAEQRVQRILGVVDRQVGRLDRMVSDLLDRAQIEAGHLTLELGEHDLCDIARDAAELFVNASPAHPLKLEVPDTPVIARCDPARIEQTLINLLSNAIKYSPDGGEIVLALRAESEHVVLSVHDHGTGITKDDLQQLFRPFRRNPLVAQEKQVPGAGLGLSIVRRIVTAHGGEVEVDSEPGKGSTFAVRLPRDGGAQASTRAAGWRSR